MPFDKQRVKSDAETDWEYAGVGETGPGGGGGRMRRLFRRRVLLGGFVGAAILVAVGFGTGMLAPSAGDAPPAFRGQIAEFTPQATPKPAPAIKFTDLDGTERTLADFAGRVVLLNYWATWCAPCVEEMPALERLHARLGGPGFTVAAVSVDRQGRNVVEPFLAKLSLDGLPIYLDRSNETMRAFGVRGLPTTILIDAQGREVGRLEGAAAWDSPAAEALIRHYMAPAG